MRKQACATTSVVMAGLDPGIHPRMPIDVDGRVKPGHEEFASSQHPMPPSYAQSPAFSRYPIPVSVSTYCGRSGSDSIFCRSWRT
ncbi:hypothetical protein EHH60_27460 [Bradyrhizobium sp. RP6]|nr:hypothetical protein EHH60_27460 [Bradyrhizobium sp. RP6]